MFCQLTQKYSDSYNRYITLKIGGGQMDYEHNFQEPLPKILDENFLGRPGRPEQIAYLLG